MKPDMFKTPVTILTGLGIPTPVKSVLHAYQLLMDWPAACRDRGHAVATNACLAALNGLVDAETARGLFAAFAERQDVLAPDLDMLVAIRGGTSSDPHIH
ncbi:DUF982 domain-containing protein [Rhizobium sp. NZLR1b]|uniref:DUF982 domain-containing protein n=1 Tax=unclassified Rhizobium TaxID=2613769 RepID=UPI001C83F56F|nr:MULTISPECIES: DUF982 domain-containing protein [unclassified Rhizobium]MBX5174608.1 DUF982 domain-containing protein [Rhizobium sp. NZLR1b]MBX5186251.1 DUF982 domain-containing protein [Rhizobium sp. NZLR5]MBX5191916.1 DUF982 domain-containing protein [Rhizobium sp. NZLR3b]